MFQQASRRNRAAIVAGVVELHVAAAERLPFGDAGFDKALTLHSLGHWSVPDQGLREVHRVLKPGGNLVIGLRGRHATETVEATLAGAGFVVRRAARNLRARHGSTLLVAVREASARR